MFASDAFCGHRTRINRRDTRSWNGVDADAACRLRQLCDTQLCSTQRLVCLCTRAFCCIGALPCSCQLALQ